MDPKELKKITEKYSIDQIDNCLRDQLAKGENKCDLVDETDTVIAELSKATVIKELMNTGLSFSEALRELGRRIRAIYGNDEG